MKDRNQKLIIFGAILLGPVIYALAAGLPNMAPFQTKNATITSLLSALVNATNLNGIINPASGIGPFTADPTGVNDSTAAIQAALDLSNTNTVELPAGTFSISGATGANCRPLFLGNHTLRGQGQTATTLKVSPNGCNTPITTWTCARSVSGTCTSGTGAMTLTLNFATPPFAFLNGVNFNCLPIGGGPACELVQAFGVNPGTIQRYFVFGGGLNGLMIGGPNGGLDFPTFANGNPLTATSLQIAIDAGTPTANSGTGGTFGMPISGIMVYDARNGIQANATNWTITGLSASGGCHACDTSASGWTPNIINLNVAGGFTTGGFVMNGRIENVSLADTFDGIFAFDTSGLRIKNVRCDTLSHDCFAGNSNSNLLISGMSHTNAGFPWQGSTSIGFTHVIETAFSAAGFSNEILEHIYFEPSTIFPLTVGAFGIGGFQVGNGVDATHKLFHGVIIRDLTVKEACLPNGGMISLFADDVLIDGINSDISRCATPPANGTGFVEIGGSNNHVTNGHNVHPVWAGVDGVTTHFSNIEFDHLQWNSWGMAATTTAFIQIAGQQNTFSATCEIDNINIHDNQVSIDGTTGNHGVTLVALNNGDNASPCAIRHADVHDNIGHNFNGANPQPAFTLFGASNGPGGINNFDWHYHDNQVDGFSHYMQAQCAPPGIPIQVGTIVENLRIDHELSDTTLANAFLDSTHTGGCTANNFNGVQLWSANNWAGFDYNVAHNGVTGTITGIASTCVTGTAANTQFLVGAQGSAVRTDGAALQSGNFTRVNVAANGTATVTVCSGTTLEPAGTYNISITNPQF